MVTRHRSDREPSSQAALGERPFDFECELEAPGCPLASLRQALAREEDLLREKDELIRQQQILSRESDHRLLNGLQIAASFLSLQSRASSNPECQEVLLTAADRVAAVARIHQRLHCLDGQQTVRFKQYLDALCSDFSGMLSAGDSEAVIACEGAEIDIPIAIATPLAFAVSELLMNAVKHGSYPICVNLEMTAQNILSVSVENHGASLPSNFDPAACKGLGMKIIRSLIQRLNGELQFGRGTGDHGAKFVIAFPLSVEAYTRSR